MSIKKLNQIGLDGIAPEVDKVTQIHLLETEAEQLRSDMKLANEIIYTLKALVPAHAKQWMRLDALNLRLKKHYT